MKVLHCPELPEWQRISRPPVPAKDYRAGTIVEHDNRLWRVYWDEQDHELEWQQVKPGDVDLGAFVRPDPHMSPEWAALVGATSTLGEAAARWQKALDAYKTAYPKPLASEVTP